MIIQKGDTKFWVVTPIDTASNVAVAADTYNATLYDNQENVINGSMPITIVNTATYRVEVDTSSLDIGSYILEFKCTINSVNKVIREKMSVVFV